MKSLVWVLLLATTLPLTAQEPEDTAAALPPNGGGAEAQQLRKQIRQRWNEHVRSTLGLSDDQTVKLQTTEQRFEGQRQPIRARQREINQALNTELGLGTPNQDRVRQLVNERQDNQLKLQQVNRDEAREMQGYLTPVQHARYQEERRRFQERVADLVRHRREARRQMPGPGRGQGRYRAAGSESCRGRSERQGQAGQPLLACPWCAQLSALLNCSQRPSSVASPFGVPSASVNPAKIHGLPPTPPSTGCFGKVKFKPAGMTVTLRVTSAWCGPPTGLSLLRKMIRADMPAIVTPLVKLM